MDTQPDAVTALLAEAEPCADSLHSYYANLGPGQYVEPPLPTKCPGCSNTGLQLTARARTELLVD